MEKIPRTRNYPNPRLVKLFVRHIVTVNNLRAAAADPKKDRIGGRQPKVRVAPQGPDQARAFADLAEQELPEILRGGFVIVGLSRSLAQRARVTSEVVRDAWGLSLPIRKDNRLAELHKGFRVFGGHQGCLRSGIVTEAYKQRRRELDWDFRYGRPACNGLGLHYLSNAETERQAGARVLHWINRRPLVSEEDIATGLPLVDVGFGHGMSGTRGIAMALHGNNPNQVGISVAEAEQRYKLPNASGFVLAHDESGLWIKRGHIILPEHR